MPKSYIASPPDVLRIDEKNLREYSIMNVTGVILTTNHKTDGLFLPPDDRRHYVAWSPLVKSHLTPDEWPDFGPGTEQGGFDDVVVSLTFPRSAPRRRRRKQKHSGQSPTPIGRPRTPS